MNLAWDEFQRLSGKYGQIMAIRIDDSAGDAMACVTLNVPPDFPDDLYTQPVRDVLHTVIEECRTHLK